MVSPIIGSLSFALFVLYSILGIILFFNPTFGASQFAWKISPFVAMTIGGWAIGAAYFAFTSFKSGQWNRIYPNLIFLWIFGAAETIILLLFKNKIILNTPLSLIYTGTLLLNCVFSAIGVSVILKNGIPENSGGKARPKWLQRGIIFAIITVSFIAIGALTTSEGGPVTTGKFLPEKLSLFTTRAFGVFYLSLVLTGLTLIPNKSVIPVLSFAKGGLSLTVPITAASLIYFAGFDLRKFPGAFLYIFIYILVIIAVLFLFSYYPNEKNIQLKDE